MLKTVPRVKMNQRVFNFVITVYDAPGITYSIPLGDVAEMMQKKPELRIQSLSFTMDDPHRDRITINNHIHGKTNYYRVRGEMEIHNSNDQKDHHSHLVDITRMDGVGSLDGKLPKTTIIEFELDGSYGEEVKPAMKSMIMEYLWDYFPYDEQLDTIWQLDPESVSIQFIGSEEFR